MIQVGQSATATVTVTESNIAKTMKSGSLEVFATPAMCALMEEAAQADVFVIIGTSLNVYPAAGLVRYVRPGVPIYLIDPDNAPAGSAGHVIHIQKGASEGMEELIKLL